MSGDAPILVATDSVTDAELIVNLLRDEFSNLSSSTDPDRITADFEQSKPAVLLLAFDALEKSDRYYLQLYRLNPLVHALPHRTIIFCNKNEVGLASDLCDKEVYDDYVLFWPLSHDVPRLPMAVKRALRDLQKTGAADTIHGMADQARRLVGLEAALERGVAEGSERAEAVSRSLERAEKEMGLAIDDFSNRLMKSGLVNADVVNDAAKLQSETEDLKTNAVRRSFHGVGEAVQPMRDWAGELNEELAPHLETARALKATAERISPVILVVDDDGFQRKQMAHALGRENVKLVFAASGAEALAALRKRRPDLILMDVMMPDIDGIEITRRLKSIEKFAAIPIIMITGNSKEAIVKASLKAGATDFIVKPVKKQALLKKLDKLLELTPI